MANRFIRAQGYSSKTMRFLASKAFFAVIKILFWSSHFQGQTNY